VLEKLTGAGAGKETIRGSKVRFREKKSHSIQKREIGSAGYSASNLSSMEKKKTLAKEITVR